MRRLALTPPGDRPGIEIPRALLRGAAAGLAGTAAMAALQLGVRRLRGQPLGTAVPRTWEDEPAPARLAKQAAEAVGEGRRLTKRHVPLVTTVMHWAYGTAWGALYGIAAEQLRPSPFVGGVALGAGAWMAAYAELVPVGVYEPPWRHPLDELALDLGYHLAYGFGVAGAFAALERAD
jgi:hypothetical protein